MDPTLCKFLEAQARYFERLADVNTAHAGYINALLGPKLTLTGGGTGPALFKAGSEASGASDTVIDEGLIG